MIFNKKAQGLSMNTIVIAALVLVVLVVLIVIFSGRMKDFGTNLKSCETLNGNCEDSCNSNEATHRNTNCPESQVCCVDVFADPTDVDP